MWRKQNKKASVGQHYRAAGRGIFGQLSTTIWEVERVTLGPDGLEYARLVRVRDRNDQKVVSLEALLDPTLFEVA
jgi:hypothetical protein